MRCWRRVCEAPSLATSPEDDQTELSGTGKANPPPAEPLTAKPLLGAVLRAVRGQPAWGAAWRVEAARMRALVELGAREAAADLFSTGSWVLERAEPLLATVAPWVSWAEPS